MGWGQVTEDQELGFSCVATRFNSVILNLACGEGKLAIATRSAQTFCTGMLLVAPTHALVASHLRQIADMCGISGHRLLTPGGDVGGSAAGWDAQTRAAVAALQACTTNSPGFVVVVCTPEALTHPVTRGVLAGCAQKRDCGLGVVAFDEHHVVFQWWQIRSDALAKAAGVVADVWDAARQQDPTGGAMRPLIIVMSSTLTDRDIDAIPAMHGMAGHEVIRSSMARHHVTLTLARLSASGQAVHRYVVDLVSKRGRNGPGIIVYVPSATGAVTMATAIQALLESIGGTYTADDVIAVTGKQNRDGAATLLAQFAAGSIRVAVVTEIWAQGISVPALDLVITQPCRFLELGVQVEGRLGRGKLRATPSEVHVLVTPGGHEAALLSTLVDEANARRALAAAERSKDERRILAARADLAAAERGVTSTTAVLQRYLPGHDVCADQVVAKYFGTPPPVNLTCDGRCNSCRLQNATETATSDKLLSETESQVLYGSLVLLGHSAGYHRISPASLREAILKNTGLPSVKTSQHAAATVEILYLAGFLTPVVGLTAAGGIELARHRVPGSKHYSLFYTCNLLDLVGAGYRTTHRYRSADKVPLKFGLPRVRLHLAAVTKRSRASSKGSTGGSSATKNSKKKKKPSKDITNAKRGRTPLAELTPNAALLLAQQPGRKRARGISKGK